MRKRPVPERPSFDDFKKRLPGDEGAFLVVPSGDRRYVAGTPLPLVGMSYVQQASGLLVPESMARPPQPIDLIGTYLTFEEIFGHQAGLTYVRDALQRIGRDTFIRSCADFLGSYEAMKASRKEIDSVVIGQTFKEPTASRVRALLQGNRTLTTPQSLLLLMQFALIISPEAPPEGTEPSPFIAVVLALQDDLGRKEEPESNVFRGEANSALFREVVASQAFASWSDEATMMARHHLHWEQLPAEAEGRPGRVDLKALFEEATGVSKDDFTSVGIALWAMAETHHRYPIARTVFDSFALSRSQIEAALNLFAASPEQLRQKIFGLGKRYQTQWSFDVLRRFPVMRMDDGSFLVLSKRLLLERIFGWLPIYDLTAGLKAQGQLTNAERAEQWYRAMCELDARQGLANLAPASGPGQRLYGEEDIQGAFGTADRNADAAIDYGDAWVVVEVNTHKLTRPTIVAGEASALARDLRIGVEEKAEQLEATIRHLIEDEARLTRHPVRPRRRYVALLLLTEGFPVNPMTMTAVREGLTTRSLLTDPRIGPLHILDQEELNMAEAVVESGGPSLLALLEEHENSTLHSAPFKDWMILDRGRGVGPDRARRTQKPFEAAWQPVIHRIREAPTENSNDGEENSP